MSERLRPPAIRSRLMLEVASELVSTNGWPFEQAAIDLRRQGAPDPGAVLYGGHAITAIEQVAHGDYQFAIINPSAPATLAVRGSSPFQQPISLRAVACIPSYDQLAFAVTEASGLTSVREIAERQLPLRVSLRATEDHSLQTVIPHALGASGLSLDDLIAWGGEVRFDARQPYEPDRIAAVQSGEIDAIFDEGVGSWLDFALEAGMRPLQLDEAALRALEEMGYRRSFLSTERFPRLAADVPTLDFSGFLIYTAASVPDDVVATFCAALQARKDRIPHEEGDSLPLESMCRDTAAGPIGIPLHPAAERFWRARGYIS